MPGSTPAITALRLPHRVASGQLQMDLDAAILRWVAATPGRFVLRTYGWRRPTLSLGRVEPWPEGWDTLAIARDHIEVARRPTGGDGVLHDEEATFSIAASIPGPWAAAPRAFADLVADGVASAYQTLDLAAVRVRPEERSPVLPAGATPCFARSSPGEVRVGAFKLAGIASKFTRGGALSHASLPLTPRHRDVARYRRDAAVAAVLLEGHARSAGELLGAAPAAAEFEHRIVSSLARAFDVTPRETTFAAMGLEDPSDPGAESRVAARIEVRLAARLLLRDEAGRVLLFLHTDPRGRLFWATPGGGVEPGEAMESAARREAEEELGIADADLGPAWSGRSEYTFANKAVVQHETFFRVRNPAVAAVAAATAAAATPAQTPASTAEMARRWASEGILEARWWTVEAIEASGEPIYPRDLAARLREDRAAL